MYYFYYLENRQWVPLELLEMKPLGSGIITRVKNYDSREDVALLTNRDIAIAVEQLPPLATDEYYWHQLVGLQVINQDGSVLGQVSDIMATGANDVLIVQGERRYLIPYLLGTYVISIDLETKKIVVDWDSEF